MRGYTYTYDDAYRKLSETVNYGTFELTYAYSYYKNGVKKSFTMPDGSTHEYIYDNNNQVSMISVPGQGSLTFNKYKWNLPETITLPGGTRRENNYDPFMQLKSIAVKDSRQNALMAYYYEYSPAGNVKTKNTEHGNYAYQYDELYRLTAGTNPSASNELYTYDAVGNRLTSADVQITWTYDANNRLLGYGDVSYYYDENGNLRKRIHATGTTTFTYDPDNRLVQLTTPNSQVTNYYYDPFGRRIWKEVGGVRTHFFYSDEGLIAEYDGTGNEMKMYGYTPDSIWTTNPIYQKIGSNYYWYQNDHLGTPHRIVDTNGKIVWSATYDAFGNIQVTAAEIENNLRFPGQYYDVESGLHYNWNRYYDPKTGRYLTADPIGLNGGINLFAYVGNNPIMKGDHWGLCPGDRKRCIDKFLKENYGDFIGNKLVRNFSLASYLPWSENFVGAVETSLETLIIKGGILVGVGGGGTYLISRGYRIIFQPVSDFGEIFGIYARAGASATTIQRGLLLRALATILSKALVVAGTGATAFATTADFLAYIHCKNQEE